MKCTKIKQDLTAYLDGELNQETADLIKGHLAICANCQHEVDVLKESWKALDEFEGMEVPKGFSQKVIERSKSEEEKQKSLIWRMAPRLLPYFASAAVLLLVCTIAISYVPKFFSSNGINGGNGTFTSYGDESADEFDELDEVELEDLLDDSGLLDEDSDIFLEDMDESESEDYLDPIDELILSEE